MQMISSTRVADFATWRAGYEQYEDLRREEGGMTTKQVYQSIIDEHEVSILFEVVDEARARRFLSSSRAEESMQKIGVTRMPLVGVLTPVASTVP
jgi:hypothetical protein